MDDVKLEKVPYLQPKATAEMKIKEFKLGDLFRVFNGEEDTLWPWALRMNVTVINRNLIPAAKEKRYFI